MKRLKGERMSEKRFSYEHLLECQMIFDEKTEKGYYFNGEQVDIDDVKYIVDLLNQLNDENEQLRQTIKEMKSDEKLYAKDIIKLNKDNQILKLGNDY